MFKTQDEEQLILPDQASEESEEESEERKSVAEMQNYGVDGRSSEMQQRRASSKLLLQGEVRASQTQ